MRCQPQLPSSPELTSVPRDHSFKLRIAGHEIDGRAECRQIEAAFECDDNVRDVIGSWRAIMGQPAKHPQGHWKRKDQTTHAFNEWSIGPTECIAFRDGVRLEKCIRRRERFDRKRPERTIEFYECDRRELRMPETFVVARANLPLAQNAQPVTRQPPNSPSAASGE